MKKSSLGRRSSAAAKSMRTSEFIDRGAKTGIPMPSTSTGRRRDASSDRVSDYGSIMATPLPTGGFRTPRTMTMSSGRASSIGPSKKVDSRPLLEKEWQFGAMELIQKMLMQDMEGCQIMETYKNLKQLTVADFVNISNYLLKKLDPSIEINKSNYQTELIYVLKKLQYRGKVDKHMLQTVNTLHSWPHTLGILQFLASLVQASLDFKSLGLEPLYPDNYEIVSPSEFNINFKHTIPLLHDLWNQVHRKESVPFEALIQANKDKFFQLLEFSGFTDDLFAQRDMGAKNLEEDKSKIQRTLDEYNALEQEFDSVEEMEAQLEMKLHAAMTGVDNFKAQIQEKLNTKKELKDITNYTNEECTIQQKLLDRCCPDKNEITEEEYEAYKKKKEVLERNISYERDILYHLSEALQDEIMKSKTIESRCANSFKEYNKCIHEIMSEDVSVRGAVCHTRPKLGVTPCNEATALLLERTLMSFQQKISSLEEELKECSFESEQFKEDEELKTKRAILDKLKRDYTDELVQLNQEMSKLEKELCDVDKEIIDVNREIKDTEEELKKNNQDFEEIEKEIQLKDERYKKLKHICQRRLEIRYETIEEMDLKMKKCLDDLSEPSQRILNKLNK